MSTITSETFEMMLMSIADDLILELCFEVHYNIKCGDMTLNEIYGLPAIDSCSDQIQETCRDSRKNNGNSQLNIVTCPVCYETVAGQRFAPHLEKCLNGGKRGGGAAKKASSTSMNSISSMGIGLPYYTAPKRIDPFPQSLIIRIRMKDGVPRKNQIREGGLLSDFTSWREIEEAALTSNALQAGKVEAVPGDVDKLIDVDTLDCDALQTEH